jgi:hypothetical protein
MKAGFAVVCNSGVHVSLGDPEIELGAPTIVMGKPRVELQAGAVFAPGSQPSISMAAPRIIIGDAKVHCVCVWRAR